MDVIRNVINKLTNINGSFNANAKSKHKDKDCKDKQKYGKNFCKYNINIKNKD